MPTEEDPEDPGAGGRILIPGAYPGYITLEQYESNRARLVANRNSFAGTRYKGSAREGMSLLHGIVLCGRCGRHMNVRYERNGYVQYSCRSQRTRRACQDVQGATSNPSSSRWCWRRSRARSSRSRWARSRSSRSVRRARPSVEKRSRAARYEAERAARRYHRVEPENRLVARTLERSGTRDWRSWSVWRGVRRGQAQAPFELSAAQREKILDLAQDLPRLWQARNPPSSLSERKSFAC